MLFGDTISTNSWWVDSIISLKLSIRAEPKMMHALQMG